MGVVFDAFSGQHGNDLVRKPIDCATTTVNTTPHLLSSTMSLVQKASALLHRLSGRTPKVRISSEYEFAFAFLWYFSAVMYMCSSHPVFNNRKYRVWHVVIFCRRLLSSLF
jgi:hypothetical protein